MDARLEHQPVNCHAEIALNESSLCHQNGLPLCSLFDCNAPTTSERSTPKHIVAFHHGYTCAVNGKYKQAMTYFQKVIKHKPDFAAAYFNMGWLFNRSGKIVEAIAAYHRAIEISPNFRESYFNLCIAFMRSKQLTEAIKTLSKVIKIEAESISSPLLAASADLLWDIGLDTSGTAFNVYKDSKEKCASTEEKEPNILTSKDRKNKRLMEAIVEALDVNSCLEHASSRPRWENRRGDDLALTPEAFVAKYYAAEKAAVNPRPRWTKDGPYADKPAEFIALAYAPEMAAGTLHRGVVGSELAAKLTSWLRTHRMPEGIDIPTKWEWLRREEEHQPSTSPAHSQGVLRQYNREAGRRHRARRARGNK